IDLTLSNPTRAGFAYPSGLLDPVADDAAFVYEPQPLGRVEARSAVVEDYRRRGTAIDVERIALTASTSEAYSILFKVLCDPGDRVAVPQPSYPLFEHLTRLDAVVPVPYQIEYHGRWTIDREGLERVLASGTRAVLLVTPNNPTGSFASTAELEWLAGI